MSSNAVAIADSASSPPPPGTPTIAQWKAALKKVKGVSGIRGYPPAWFALGTWLVPFFILRAVLPGTQLLELIRSWRQSSPGYEVFTFFGPILLWFGLVGLLCWPFITRTRRTMTRRLLESQAIPRLLSGELDLNAIDNYVHPLLRRMRRFPPISSPEDQLLRLIHEADWFVNPPRRIARLDWLSAWVWLLLVLPGVALFFWGPPFFLLGDPGPGWHWLFYVLAVPASAAGLLFFAAISANVIRSFCVPLWGTLIIAALERELERLEPAPKPQPRPAPPPPPPPELSKRLGEDLTTGLQGNAAVPWAVWAAPTSFFVLFGVMSASPTIGFGQGAYLPAWNLLCVLILLGLPLLATILDARRQLRVVREYLVRVDAGYLLAMRHDTRLHTGPTDLATQLPGAVVSGSTEQAVVDTAAELGARLMAQRGSGMRPMALRFCLGSAALAMLSTVLSFNYDNFADYSMYPVVYILPAIGLAFVNAPYRRRMMVEELVLYMRRSLKWDGEAPAREVAG